MAPPSRYEAPGGRRAVPIAYPERLSLVKAVQGWVWPVQRSSGPGPQQIAAEVVSNEPARNGLDLGLESDDQYRTLVPSRALTAGESFMKIRSTLSMVLATACLAGSTAGAAEIEGVRFLDQRRFGDEELRLHNTGLLRYRVIIKAYVAALYLGDSVRGEADDVLADVPRRLEIEYFWALGADQFAQATIEGISRNTDPAAFEKLRERIYQLNALYEDVEPGDRYALTYLPGVGTELALNDRRLGVIEGADFSEALFGIWIGDQPLDESLRTQLVDGA